MKVFWILSHFVSHNLSFWYFLSQFSETQELIEWVLSKLWVGTWFHFSSWVSIMHLVSGASLGVDRILSKALQQHQAVLCSCTDWLQSILSLQYRWWKVPEPPSVRLSEVSPSRPLNGAAAPWGGGGWRDEDILGRGWTPPYRAHRRHHFDPQLAQPSMCAPSPHLRTAPLQHNLHTHIHTHTQMQHNSWQ